MILIKIKKFPAIDGLEHLTTTWVLARDREMTDVISVVSHSPSKDLYYSEAVVPENVVYYLKGIRHFSDPSVNLDSDIIEIIGKNKNNSDNVLLLEDIHFEKPTVYLDSDFETSEILKIRCSHPRAEMEVHDYTTWLIVDGENNVLYSRVEDEINKINIPIKNDPKYKTKSSIRILCIHGSKLGIESPIGELCISNTNSNFVIDTSLSNLKAYKDNVIEFKAVDKSKPLGIHNVKLYNNIDNRVIKNYNNIIDSVTIPWIACTPNSSLGMEINFVDSLGKVSTKTIELTFKHKYVSDIKDKDFIYSKTVERLTVNAQSYVPNNCIVESTFDGITLIPSLLVNRTNGKSVVKLIKHRVDNVKGIVPESTNNILTTVEELNDTNTIKEGTLIKVLNGDMLLIDKLNNSGTPTFTLLQRSVNHTTPTYLSILHIERVDETKSLGFTGGIVQEDNKSMLYIPVGTNIIKRLDFETKTVSKVTDIYTNDTRTDRLTGDNLTMLKLHNRNSVLIVGSSSSGTVIYNYDNNTFEEGPYFTPISYVNKPIKVIQLINGDMLIVKGTLDNSDTEADSHALYYKLGSERLEELTNVRFGDTNRYPSTWVLCPDGKLGCLINQNGTSNAESNIIDNRVHSTTYFK